VVSVFFAEACCRFSIRSVCARADFSCWVALWYFYAVVLSFGVRVRVVVAACFATRRPSFSVCDVTVSILFMFS